MVQQGQQPPRTVPPPGQGAATVTIPIQVEPIRFGPVGGDRPLPPPHQTVVEPRPVAPLPPARPRPVSGGVGLATLLVAVTTLALLVGVLAVTLGQNGDLAKLSDIDHTTTATLRVAERTQEAATKAAEHAIKAHSGVEVVIDQLGKTSVLVETIDKRSDDMAGRLARMEPVLEATRKQAGAANWHIQDAAKRLAAAREVAEKRSSGYTFEFNRQLADVKSRMQAFRRDILDRMGR